MGGKLALRTWCGTCPWPIKPLNLSKFIMNGLLGCKLLYVVVRDFSELNHLFFYRYSPISKAQFEADIFSPYFSTSLSSSSAVNTLSTPTSPSSSLSANGTPLSPISSGRLSVLFMVLAIGTLMDPNNEAYNIEAEKYHQIARAALFSTRPSVFDDPTLQSVQALVSLLNLSLFLLFDYLGVFF